MTGRFRVVDQGRVRPAREDVARDRSARRLVVCLATVRVGRGLRPARAGACASRTLAKLTAPPRPPVRVLYVAARRWAASAWRGAGVGASFGAQPQPHAAIGEGRSAGLAGAATRGRWRARGPAGPARRMGRAGDRDRAGRCSRSAARAAADVPARRGSGGFPALSRRGRHARARARRSRTGSAGSRARRRPLGRQLAPGDRRSRRRRARPDACPLGARGAAGRDPDAGRGQSAGCHRARSAGSNRRRVRAELRGRHDPSGPDAPRPGGRRRCLARRACEARPRGDGRRARTRGARRVARAMARVRTPGRGEALLPYVLSAVSSRHGGRAGTC